MPEHTPPTDRLKLWPPPRWAAAGISFAVLAGVFTAIGPVSGIVAMASLVMGWSLAAWPAGSPDGD